MKIYILILSTLLIAASAMGQEISKETTGLEKGFYCNVEIATDLSYDKNVSAVFNTKSSFNFAYDITLAFGYRFIPQFTLAAGFGGSANTYAWDTSIPVFLRLRSDILDRKVSPYVQLDLGWNFFGGGSSANKYYDNKPNIEILDSELAYKYNGSTRDKYIYDYIDSHRNAYYNKLSNAEKYEWEMNMEKEAEASLNQFSNGQKNYSIPKEELSTYGKCGLFSVFTIGISWKVGTRTRMNAGISTGLVQYTFGEYAKTNNLNNEAVNPSVWMGCAGFLPSNIEESKEMISWSGYRYNEMGEKISFENNEKLIESSQGTAIFARGDAPFWERFKPCGQIRIGFTF